MILIAGGDSFIYGSELRDCPHGSQHSVSTFPALLAKFFNMKYHCCAYPGYANTAIARTVIKACESRASIPEERIVVVSWTFGQRVEGRFPKLDGNGSEWYNLNLYHLDREPIYSTDLDHDMLREYAKTYFRTAGNTEYYEIYSILKEVLYLQQYLKSKGIKYLFTTADNIFYQHENYKRSWDRDLEIVYNLIDWDCWYFFPEGTESGDTQSPRGFYQWAVENKYSVGEHHHPLEKAHIDAARLMRGKFDELVKKNN